MRISTGTSPYARRSLDDEGWPEIRNAQPSAASVFLLAGDRGFIARISYDCRTFEAQADTAIAAFRTAYRNLVDEGVAA